MLQREKITDLMEIYNFMEKHLDFTSKLFKEVAFLKLRKDEQLELISHVSLMGLSLKKILENTKKEISNNYPNRANDFLISGPTMAQEGFKI